MPAHVWSLPPPHNRSTANDAGNAPKLRTGVFRGKCDSDVPRLFTGPTETTPSTARSFRVVPRRRWRASLAGVAGGRRWRASLAESQAKPHKNRGDLNYGN